MHFKSNCIKVHKQEKPLWTKIDVLYGLWKLPLGWSDKSGSPTHPTDGVPFKSVGEPDWQVIYSAGDRGIELPAGASFSGEKAFCSQL